MSGLKVTISRSTGVQIEDISEANPTEVIEVPLTGQTLDIPPTINNRRDISVDFVQDAIIFHKNCT
jgi:hypothetical protein